MIDGALYRGSTGGAGEFGHTRVDGSYRRCECGKLGCLEASVAEPALLAQARELRRAKRTREPATSEDLYRLVAEDADCAELVASAGRMLGRGVANLVNVFAPEPSSSQAKVYEPVASSPTRSARRRTDTSSTG